MSRVQKLTATVSAVALLGAGGFTAAQAATSTSATKSSSSARPHGKHRGGPLATAQLAAIAKTLGVTSAQLKAALDATRPAKPTGSKPKGDGRATDATHKTDHAARETAMYAAIAKELGLSADAVKAAFDANRPAKPTK